MNHKKPSAIIQQLAFLSVKQNVYPAELFQALVSAREQGKTSCQGLTIEYRGSINREAILLISEESRVIGQFRVAEEFLLRKDISFENWMDTDKIRRQRNRQNTLRFATSVEHLRHGMKKVNLEAEVLEASKPALVHTQWGNSATVTNVLIGDETGKIKLCLWNEQVGSVCVGDTIQVKNASVSTYKGERQLRLAKNGSIVLMPKMALTPSVSAKSKI